MGKSISSDSFLVHRKAEDIYNFLSDFTNFSHLMPEQVQNWAATPDQCSFEIKGLATLGMKMIERLPFSKVVMEGEGKLPFDFNLSCHFESEGETSTKVVLVMDADMNPFISMMAEKPMHDFINLLAARLKQVMES
jgi:carbon monoxide dehydrogenase subunit G